MSAVKTTTNRVLPDDITALKKIIAETETALAIKDQRIATLEEFVLPPRNFLFCLDLVGLTRLAVTN